MSDITRQVARLLERAQSGHAQEALAAAESALRDGDRAGMHFVRAVALETLGEDPIPALGLMVRAAEREGSPGWRACALATRASERLRLGEEENDEYDVDAALRDLSAAETALLRETDQVAAVNARVGIAVGYLQLRLYELAGPQYEAAYEISAASPEQNGNRAMWLSNLAEMHLLWALELYQVGESASAEEHTAAAEEFAVRSAAESCGADAGTWREMA